MPDDFLSSEDMEPAPHRGEDPSGGVHHQTGLTPTRDRSPPHVRSVPLADIRIDGDTQSRAAINREVVAEYSKATKPSAAFPPVVLFFDGTTYWMADGFHRYEAHLASGATGIAAEVRQGTQRDAILYSVGANTNHGLRRTIEDKRRAVLLLLNDPEWSGWADREIARQCVVSHPFVAKLREGLTGNVSSDETRTYTTKHGTQARMDTAAIGKGKAAKAPKAAPAPVPAASAPEDEPHHPVFAEKPGQSEPPADPYGHATLTRAALLAIANRLRADLDEEKAMRTTAECERDKLKARIMEMSDTGRRARANRPQTRKTNGLQLELWPEIVEAHPTIRPRSRVDAILAGGSRWQQDEGTPQRGGPVMVNRSADRQP